MQLNDSERLLQESSADSEMSLLSTERMFVEAFEALPDGIYLFGGDRRLVKANGAAAQFQSDKLLKGKPCCEMFWRVDGTDGCLVDRALQTGEKVSVEIQAGAEGKNSISIVVEPLGTGDGLQPAALVIARDSLTFVAPRLKH